MRQKTGDIAQFLNIAEPTVRVWATEFADFLSEQATPDKGKTRWYTEKDLQVLFYAKQMRDENVGYEEIRELLTQNKHLATVPVSIEENTVELFSPEFVKQVQSQLQKTIEVLENERDYLRSQLAEHRQKLQSEQQTRIELEKQIAYLKGQIDTTDKPS